MSEPRRTAEQWAALVEIHCEQFDEPKLLHSIPDLLQIGESIVSVIRRAVEQARAETREECAKRLEESAEALEFAQPYLEPPAWKRVAESLRKLAAAIRAAKQP